MKRTFPTLAGVALILAGCAVDSGPSSTSSVGEATSTASTNAVTGCDNSSYDNASTTSEMSLDANDLVALVGDVEISGEDCRDFTATVARVLFMADSAVVDPHVEGGMTLPEVVSGDRISGRIFPGMESGHNLLVVGLYGVDDDDWGWGVTAFPVLPDGSLGFPDAYPDTRKGFERLLSDIDRGVVCGYEMSSEAEILAALVAEARHERDYELGETTVQPDTHLKDSYNGTGGAEAC